MRVPTGRYISLCRVATKYSLVAAFIAVSGATPCRAQSPPPPATPAPAPPGSAALPDLINPDRPGIADGSRVIGPHRFQAEIGFEQDRHRDAGTTQQALFFPTLLRFGISERWEGRVEGNTYATTRSSDPTTGTSRSSGYNPTSLGGKYHFLDHGPLSLGSIVRIFPASGTGDYRTHHPAADVRLAADYTLTPNYSLNPNVGVGSYEDAQGRTFTTGLLALTLNYVDKSQTVNPFVDMGVLSPEARGGKSAVTVDTGIAVIVRRNYQLDASVGTGVVGRTPPHPFYAAGVSTRF